MTLRDPSCSAIRFLQSNILLYCVICLLILKIATTIAFFSFPQSIFFADISRAVLINLVNQGREAAGVSPLAENEKLDQAAFLKAQDMINNQYFDHISPTGTTPWHWFSEAGYDYYYAGENLAVGFYDSTEVYQAWINSPSHKENTLNANYKEMGIAVLPGFGRNNATVVVQLFASPKLQIVKNSDDNVRPINKTINTDEEKSSKTPSYVPVGLPMVLGEAKNLGNNNFYSKITNYVLYNHEGLLRTIVYGVALIVIGTLYTAIIFNETGFKKNFILRAFILVLVLSAAILIDKDTIILFLPHQIII